MTLHSIPDELILEVAKHLENIYDDNRALAPLAICSRHINNILSPLLYRKFTQTSNKPGALPTLLRLVMQNSRMRVAIRSLVLQEIDDYESTTTLEMSGYSAGDFEECQAAMESFVGLSVNKLEWLGDLKNGIWDAVLSLLLFHLPFLEDIKIESQGGLNFTYLDPVTKYLALQHHVDNPSHSLKHLTHFSTAYWDTENGMGIKSILPFCRLPSVTTVSVQSLEQDHDLNPFPSPPRDFQVRDLRITSSCVNANALKNLLRCFTSLQKFYYDHAGATVGLSSFLPQKVGEGLAHLHNFLEELILYGQNEDVFDNQWPRPLGTLADFTKLRYISTSADILYGPKSEPVTPNLASILPVSLEVLHIASCDDDIYSQLRDLVSDGDQAFSILKTIRIGMTKGREGALYFIGPDGLDRRGEITQQLELFQSNQPSAAEWEQWRICQGIEKKLIDEYSKAGKCLDFDLHFSCY